LNLVFANKVILGVDGISLKHGCTVPTNAEAEVVRRMIERTKGQVIVVADHSKWGAVSNFPVASIEEVDKFVTDEGFAKSAVGRFGRIILWKRFPCEKCKYINK
jgi:DeoR family fructose operon transcriptional repressor